MKTYSDERGGWGKMKYIVYGHTTLTCSMKVEADSPEEAIEKATDEFGGLTNYAGMGSVNCLVGVLNSSDERSIFADSDIEFDEAVEV